MQSPAQHLEINIEQAKAIVARGEKLQRLSEIPEFRELILEGYLEQESIRLVQAKSDPALQTPELQGSIVTQIDGIGAFLNYLRRIEQSHDMAQRDLTQYMELEASGELEDEE